MRFKISESAQNFFSNIIGSHGSEDKTKFLQFDVYYCCAIIGMAAVQLDDDQSDLGDMIEKYPKQYAECKAQIAGLLVATEAKRQGIDPQSTKLEELMLRYLSNDDTMLSEEGIKTLNAYALKGYHLIHEFPLEDKPNTREEFLDAFNLAVEYYSNKTNEE